MRIPMKARKARSAVLAATVVATLAAGGGLAYGSAAEDDSGTAGAVTEKAAPAVSSAGTASMVPRQGVKPSSTSPQGSTAERTPPATGGSAPTAKSSDVDKSDRGAKNVRSTKDKGKKNLPATKDLGDR